MFTRVVASIAVLIIWSAALAETLVVYPFNSRGSFLGAAVADLVATSFEEQLDVHGPAVAPSLVPPLPVGEGYLNPTEFLRGSGVASRSGTRLLQDALGADAVLTGTISASQERLEATVFLAHGEKLSSFRATAPLDDPGRLATSIVRGTARRLELSVERSRLELDMSGQDGHHAQAVALLAAGMVDEVAQLMASVEDPQPRLAEIARAIEELRSGGSNAHPALLATMAINSQPLDERAALRYFNQLAGSSELPAAQLWVPVLEASLNDPTSAAEHFDAIPQEYAYGRAARSAYLAGRGDPGPAERERLLESADMAALLGLATVAEVGGDTELEKEALQRLTRVAPFFAYPFERLSFIAFDEGDGLSAAKALAVAVELEPQSDLYWTNLGWAYYLLGMLQQSEEASLRAVELEPAQYVAHYNLGLVQAVTGRLEEALQTYETALRVDPEVDDAAVEDLEQALELYPGQPAVHYVLGLLYESEGRRKEAAEQYALYAQRVDEGAFRDAARERAELLSAPPPAIELVDGIVNVHLGSRQLAAAPFHPGDPLYPRFEVYTRGEELPQELEVSIELVDGGGGSVMTVERSIEIPRRAVGYVVNEVELELPEDLEAGTYRLDVSVRASEERRAEGSVFFEVTGEPELLRRLLGRNLVMHGLQGGTRLYGPEQLGRGDQLVERLLGELRSSADTAEEVLPTVETGRFEGLSGGELFRSSTAGDVTDFLEHLLASGAHDATFIFAEAYAQWALEGAPEAGE